MATTILLDDDVRIPFVRSLAEFRAWAASETFPERGRIDFLNGAIEVDMSPEDLYYHGALKTRLVIELGKIVDSEDLGELYADRTRVSCPEVGLSVEPDVVFVTYEALESGRVRRVAKASGDPDAFAELEGPPDLVVEIVSDRSVAKDTQRLPRLYYEAGVGEYWLFDVRRERLNFQVLRRGRDQFDPVLPDTEGRRRSETLRRSFQLRRRRARGGGWKYELEHR